MYNKEGNLRGESYWICVENICSEGTGILSVPISALIVTLYSIQ